MDLQVEQQQAQKGQEVASELHGRLCGEWEGKINMENALSLYEGQYLRKNASTPSSTAIQPILQTEKLRSMSRRSLHRRSLVCRKKLYTVMLSLSAWRMSTLVEETQREQQRDKLDAASKHGAYLQFLHSINLNLYKEFILSFCAYLWLFYLFFFMKSSGSAAVNVMLGKEYLKFLPRVSGFGKVN